MNKSSNSKWTVLDTGKKTAQENMDRDLALLKGLKDEAILHFYEWEGNCATHGYFIDPHKHLNPQGIQKHALQIARRPTGGGIVFHLTDFAFSVLVPSNHAHFSLNTLENYRFVNQKVSEAIGAFQGIIPELLPQQKGPPNPHFCMAQPTIYDLVINGKKIGGAAQRRIKEGFLHQGTISIALPPQSFLDDLLIESKEIQENSYILSKNPSLSQLTEIRHFLRNYIKNAFLLNF